MKTIKNITFVIICFLLISCGINDVELTCEERIKARLEYVNIARPVDSYNYPVYPGMPEWSEFQTMEEMIAACQVPENILNEMSTQAIIQAIWEYPFVLVVLHRYHYQADFDGTFSGNNAYNALTKRNDAGTALLERLKATNPLMPLIEGEPKFLEILISQDVFLSQLDETQKKAVIIMTLENDKLRQDCGESNNNRATAWLLIGKLLKNAAYEPFIEEMNNNEQLQSFIENLWHTYFPDYGYIPQLIVSFANEYIKS
ncbi:MAG: hypothetical protein LBG80_16185 [Bacteroidales bacterium]|nr:hypothetical protein [Bacteroidales bacterium]